MAEAGVATSVIQPLSADVEASLGFDREWWSEAEFERVLERRRHFCANLRPHDGLSAAAARQLLQKSRDKDTVLPSLLAWVLHTGRVHLLKPMLSLVPDTRSSLLSRLMRWSPRLALLEAVMPLLPGSLEALASPSMSLSLLHELVQSVHPPLDTLRWLLGLLERTEARWSRFDDNNPLCLLLQKQKTQSPVPHLLELVRALLQWEPQLARHADRKTGRYALWFACDQYRPSLPLLQELHAAHSPAALCFDSEGFTPLHQLIRMASGGALTVEMVKLLSTGDAASVLAATTTSGYTPLHVFVRRAAPELELAVLRYLCDACPAAVTARTKRDETTLMCLAEHSGSMPVAQLLLERDPALSAHATSTGNTALSFAASRLNAARLPLFLKLLDLHPEHACLQLNDEGSVLLDLLGLRRGYWVCHQPIRSPCCRRSGGSSSSFQSSAWWGRMSCRCTSPLI